MSRRINRSIGIATLVIDDYGIARELLNGECEGRKLWNNLSVIQRRGLVAALDVSSRKQKRNLIARMVLAANKGLPGYAVQNAVDVVLEEVEKWSKLRA